MIMSLIRKFFRITFFTNCKLGHGIIVGVTKMTTVPSPRINFSRR